MARVIENPDFTADREVYEWDSWLDGRTLQIERGDDYNCKEVTMLTLLRTQARNRRKLVRTKIVKDGDNVVGIQFQAYPASEQQIAEWMKQDEAREQRKKGKKEATNIATTDEQTVEDQQLVQQMDEEVKQQQEQEEFPLVPPTDETKKKGGKKNKKKDEQTV